LGTKRQKTSKEAKEELYNNIKGALKAGPVSLKDLTTALKSDSPGYIKRYAEHLVAKNEVKRTQEKKQIIYSL
jgi:hypothetical protein